MDVLCNIKQGTTLDTYAPLEMTALTVADNHMGQMPLYLAFSDQSDTLSLSFSLCMCVRACVPSALVNERSQEHLYTHAVLVIRHETHTPQRLSFIYPA